MALKAPRPDDPDAHIQRVADGIGGVLAGVPDGSLCASCVALATGASLDEANRAIVRLMKESRLFAHVPGRCGSCGRSLMVVRVLP